MLSIVLFLVTLAVSASAEKIKYDVKCTMGPEFPTATGHRGNIYLFVTAKESGLLKLVKKEKEAEKVILNLEEVEKGYIPFGNDMNPGQTLTYDDIAMNAPLEKFISVQFMWLNGLGGNDPAQIQKCTLTQKSGRGQGTVQSYCYNGKPVYPGEKVDAHPC